MSGCAKTFSFLEKIHSDSRSSTLADVNKKHFLPPAPNYPPSQTQGIINHISLNLSRAVLVQIHFAKGAHTGIIPRKSLQQCRKFSPYRQLRHQARMTSMNHPNWYGEHPPCSPLGNDEPCPINWTGNLAKLPAEKTSCIRVASAMEVRSYFATFATGGDIEC